MNALKNGRLAGWLESSSAALPASPNTDFSSAVRLGLWLLGLGFGGFLLWASLAPLDEGVPSPGVLSVDSKRKSVEHLTGGLVERILVRDGQEVQKGQELVVLNETQAKAAMNATLSQWRAAAAAAARLEAERSGARDITFPDELARVGDTEALAAMRTQRDLLQARRNALDGDRRIIHESITGLEHQLASLDQLKVGREKQIALVSTQLDSFRKLSEKGFVSRNQLLDVERQLAEIQSRQSEDLSNIAGINARLAELRMRDRQRMVDYRHEVETQLGDVRKEESVLAERVAATRDSHERLVLRAPVSGTVVDVAVHTEGGVVKPGEKLMDILPGNDELVVEAQMPPQYIDRVQRGMQADVHFDSYVSLASRPVVTGRVTMVSADTLTDSRTGRQYYSLNVSVPAAEIGKLGQVRLLPGMQATVMVKTGERTLMAYLLRPLLKRFETSLVES